MNSTIVILVFGTLIFGLFAFFIILYVMLQKRKQHRHMLETQELQHKFKEELLQSRLEVQEQSLRYFSEEIHDNIGQVLSLVKLHMYKISQQADSKVVSESAVQGTELLTKAIADLRTISQTANGSFVQGSDLLDILRKETGYVAAAKSIQCELVVSGNPVVLPQEQQLLIFRIVQESMANAIKHGNATEIEISVAYEPQMFNLSVADNGYGFELPENGKPTGLGLINMNNRAQLLNGNFTIRSKEGEGTIVNLQIPMA